MLVLEVKVILVDDVKILHLFGPVRQCLVKFIQLRLVNKFADPLVQSLSELAPETEKKI